MPLQLTTRWWPLARGSKVQRKTITIRITDTQPFPGDQHFVPQNGWTLDAQRRPTNTVANDRIATHHQYAVSVLLPLYWDQSITNPRAVKIVSLAQRCGMPRGRY